MRDLADLERFRPSESDVNPDVPAEVVTQIRISMARIEGKLDQVINLSSTVATLKDALTKAETRLTKLEAWQSFALWAFSAVQGIMLVILGAGLTYFWHH